MFAPRPATSAQNKAVEHYNAGAPENAQPAMTLKQVRLFGLVHFLMIRKAAQ
jgi:hypothetical protein